MLLKPSEYPGAKDTAVAGRAVTMSEQELKYVLVQASEGTRQERRSRHYAAFQEGGSPVGGHASG